MCQCSSWLFSSFRYQLLKCLRPLLPAYVSVFSVVPASNWCANITFDVYLNHTLILARLWCEHDGVVYQ